MDVLEIDPNFEPQARARSNTWPLRPKEFTKEDENRSTPTSTEGDSTEQSQKDLLGFTKAKTSSRRNAWGNLSYADLITKAIESAPDKRLTLSQIYDWMVQNVPFFKDKGDSNSSAGWKNSIRHNLSLHNRFMRMQNEGTGKSSWWVINPDAKPGKSPRRRATSMDTKSFEKKRGRVKKMVEAKRAALAEAASHGSLPGSECGDSTSDVLEPFSLSPQDFRNRTSSNASSLGGRLSPIQAGVEPDLHDNQVPPMSSPIPWIPSGKPCGPAYQTPETYPMSTETLSESLAEMFMGDLSPESCGMGDALSNSQMSTPSPLQPQLSPAPSYPETSASYLPAPPPYPDQQMRRSPNPQSPMIATSLTGIGAGMSNGIITTMGNNTIAGTGMGGMSTMISNLASAESNRGLVNTSLSELLADSQDDVLGMPPTTMAVNQQFRNSAFQNQTSPSSRLLSQQRNLLASNPSLLRQALTNKAQQLQASQMQASQMQMAGGGIQSQNGLTGLSPQQQLTQQQQSMQPDLHPNLLNGGVMQTTACVTMMNNPEPAFGSVQSGLFPSLPSDLDLNYEDMRPDDLDCDVDQIIKHELSLDNNLDFDFETGQTAHDQFGSIQT